MKDSQKRFIQEFLIDANATQAAIRAGYAEKAARFTGCRLLKTPAVRAEIDKLQATIAERVQVDAEYVLKGIIETVQRCRQEISPILDNKGQPVLGKNANGDLVPMFRFDSVGALRGLELLGKHLPSFFVDRHEHTGKDGGPIETKNVRDLTDEELLKIIEEERPGVRGTGDQKARPH